MNKELKRKIVNNYISANIKILRNEKEIYDDVLKNEDNKFYTYEAYKEKKRVENQLKILEELYINGFIIIDHYRSKKDEKENKKDMTDLFKIQYFQTSLPNIFQLVMDNVFKVEKLYEINSTTYLYKITLDYDNEITPIDYTVKTEEIDEEMPF